MAERVSRVNAIVEKPKPEDAPSTLGVVGRYILTPRIFHHIETPHARRRRRNAAHRRHRRAAEGTAGAGLCFDGTRYDCGSKLGYLQATVEYALKHSEVSDDFAAYLKSRIC